MKDNNPVYQINDTGFYYKYAVKYAAADQNTRQEAREHWTRIHAENILTGRHDLIIYSAQILAAMDLAEAITDR